jgi:hypothetical protein
VDRTPADAPIDVIARSGYYFLSRDYDGFALWSIQTDGDEPVLTFPAGEDGEVLGRTAFRRETRFARWSKVLLVTAFIAGIVCIITTASKQGLVVSDRAGIDPFSDDPLTDIYTWSVVLSAIAYSTFVVAVGLFVIIWLHRRFRREG